jgi:hypothetical protein
VISVLQNLTRVPNSPTTIIASIHQPSSRLYQSFDTVLLLAEGKPLYFGPGGTAPAAYFATKGLPCPEGYNVADHLLEIASAGSCAAFEYHDRSLPTEEHPLSPIESKPFLGQGSPTVGLETLGKNDLESSQAGMSPPSLTQAARPRDISSASKTCATTFLTQLQVLSGREWRNLKR